MNQCTNRVPYGLLTKVEQAQFCIEAKERRMYEMYSANRWSFSMTSSGFDESVVYRLKILPSEWYYTGGGPVKGSTLLGWNPDTLDSIRPAKPSEIPKPVPTLQERIESTYPDYEVGILKISDTTGYLSLSGGAAHILAQSIKGFQGYVYQIEEGEFLKWKDPSHLVYGDVTMPVAVLFEK